MAPVRRNALPWLALSLLVLVLDQASKAWVLSSLPEYTAIPVIDGFWNWYRTYNTGAAFSFLSDAGGWQQYFFIALAIGNVIDRVLHGHVVDFIQWHWRDHYWPAFNIADAAIVGGAVGIALYGLFSGGSKPSAQPE